MTHFQVWAVSAWIYCKKRVVGDLLTSPPLAVRVVIVLGDFSPHFFLGGFYIFIFLGGFSMPYIHHSVGSRCSWFCFVGCHVNTCIHICKYLHHPKNESCHMNESDSFICPMTHSYVTRIIYANTYLAPVGSPVVVVPGHFVSIFVWCILIP